MKICTRSILAAASGVGLFAMSAHADKGVELEIATTTGTPSSIKAVDGGIAGGAPCSYDNGVPQPLCIGAPASQFAPAYPFFAEAADDMVLTDPGGGDNDCLITSVTTWVTFFNGSPVIPTGMYYTVYGDAGNIPDGEPIDTGGHTNSIAETFVPAALLTITDISDAGDNSVLEITGPVALAVPKDTTVWLAMAPELDFPPQTAIILTDGGNGNPAQQIFNLLALPWTAIAGAADCPDVGDTANELAFNVTGIKDVPQEPFCPHDCGDGDNNVGVTDLLALLAQWGGPGACDFDGGGVGVTDLLKLLAAWGPCPANLHDECADAGVVLEGPNDIDLKGTTVSGPAVCTIDGGDGWYTYTATAEGRLNIVATVDTYMEVYDACGGTLIDCAPSIGGVSEINVLAGDSVVIRLINDLGLPNDTSLKGTLLVTLKPPFTNEICTDAFTANIGDSILGDTTGAVDGLSTACGDAFDAAAPSHWYRITGDGNTITVSTNNPGTDPLYDTQVSVFCANCNFLADVCIGGSNDDLMPPAFIHSTFSFCSIAGQDYFVVVHGGVGANGEGAYELSIATDGVACNGAQDCGPGNDDCADHEPIFDGLTPFDTSLASTDGPDNPAGLCNDFGGEPTVHDIWYHYTATCSAELTVTTCVELGGVANYDTDIVLYGPYADPADIDCGALADPVACNDDDPVNACGTAAPFASTVILPVTSGETYLVRIGGWQDEGADLGTGSVNIFCQAAATGACCTDNGATCTEALTQEECLTACTQVEWFIGEDCTVPSCNSFTDCGDASQAHHDDPDNDPWTFGTSDTDINLIRYETVEWAGGAVNTITVDGIDAFNDGTGFAECVEDPQTLNVTLYDDAGDCTPGAIIASGSFVATRTATGQLYAGAFERNSYLIDVSSLAAAPAGNFWFSVQGEAPGDLCWFLWLSGPQGDGISYNEDTVAAPGVLVEELFDLGYCINTP